MKDWLVGPETILDAVTELTEHLVEVERCALLRVHDVAGAYQSADAEDVKVRVLQYFGKCRDDVDALSDVVCYLTGQGADGVKIAVEHVFPDGRGSVINDRFGRMVEDGIDNAMFFDGCAGDDELAGALELEYRDAESLREYIKNINKMVNESSITTYQPRVNVDHVKLFARE